MVPERRSRETAEVHLDAVRKHLSIPRPTLPPCGVRGEAQEFRGGGRGRGAGGREGGREAAVGGGEGQAEAVSGR